MRLPNRIATDGQDAKFAQAYRRHVSPDLAGPGFRMWAQAEWQLHG
jgi:hypothetical protein